MPIYEYRCEGCGHEFEALQKMSDEPLSDCSECGRSALIKKVSAAGFRLKGGGWYETDFKSGNKKNIAGSQSSGDTSAPEKSSDAKNSSAPKKDSSVISSS